MTSPALDLRLPDVGRGTPILQASCLPGGAALLGLGEAGAALVRGGEVVARFRSVAHQLAVSDDGRAAITIGQTPLDDRCWLGRLDLEAVSEAPWGDIARDRTNRYARSFDGERWYIAFERGMSEITVQALDVTSPYVTVIEEAEETGMLVGVERAGDRLRMEATSIGAERYALYAIPGLKRLSRGDIIAPRIRFPPRPDEPFELFVGSAHPPVSSEPVFAVGGPLCAEPRLLGVKEPWTVKLPGAPMGPSAIRARGPWVAVAVEGDGEREGESQILVMDLRQRRFTARIRFPGATHAGADLGSETLVSWDNRGRALVLDLGRGEVMQTVTLGA